MVKANEQLLRYMGINGKQIKKISSLDWHKSV